MCFFHRFFDRSGQLHIRAAILTLWFFQDKQEFNVSLRPSDRRIIDVQQIKPCLHSKFRRTRKHFAMGLFVSHHAILANFSTPCFKLRLYQNYCACSFPQAKKHLRKDQAY